MGHLNDLLAGDLEAGFPDLLRDHADCVYSSLLNVWGAGQDAEDATQETFLRAHQALSGYPSERIRELKLRPWLLAIALNVRRNELRRSRRHPTPESLDDVLHLSDGAESPEARLERLHGERHLAQLLLELPESHRVAVVLRHVTGLSYAEIAAALGVPQGTIKARASRGTRMLRHLIEQDSPQPKSGGRP